jgi:hypothetical protein
MHKANIWLPWSEIKFLTHDFLQDVGLFGGKNLPRASVFKKLHNKVAGGLSICVFSDGPQLSYSSST